MALGRVIESLCEVGIELIKLGRGFEQVIQITIFFVSRLQRQAGAAGASHKLLCKMQFPHG